MDLTLEDQALADLLRLATGLLSNALGAVTFAVDQERARASRELTTSRRAIRSVRVRLLAAEHGRILGVFRALDGIRDRVLEGA